MLVALRGVKPKADKPSWWEPESKMMIFFFSRSKLIFRLDRIIFDFPVGEIVRSIFK